jgi:hypothetical protein
VDANSTGKKDLESRQSASHERGINCHSGPDFAVVEPDSSKRSAYHYELWNIKYLHKFKWDNLTEEIGMCTSFFIFTKFLFDNIFNVRCKACACLRSAM